MFIPLSDAKDWLATGVLFTKHPVKSTPPISIRNNASFNSSGLVIKAENPSQHIFTS